MKTELPETVDEAWFNQLDIERLERPKAVISLIERVVRRTKPDLFPLMYLVYGAALRQTTRLNEARWAYMVGILIAEKNNNLSMRAKLIRRLTWVEAADGKFIAAHERVREALAYHTMLNEREEIGKALVSQGILFYMQEEHEKSNCSMLEALKRLKSSDTPNCFSAHQHLAMNYRALDQGPEAYRHLVVARELGEYIGKPASDKLHWHEASVNEERGGDSSEALEKIIESSLEQDNFIDAALGTLQLAKGHLNAGRDREAWSAGIAVRTFAFRSQSRAASAAALEVYRSCLKQTLTLNELSSAIEEIVKMRGAHSAPRSLIND